MRTLLIALLLALPTTAVAQRHRVVPPSLPLVNLADPFFPITGIRITDPTASYSAEVLTLPGAENSPRSTGNFTQVVIWRLRDTKYCAVQIFSIPTINGTRTTIPLDISNFKIGDGLELENWAGFDITINMNGKLLIERGPYSQSPPYQVSQLHADCSE